MRPAAETIIELFDLTDGKRGALFIVKGTEAQIIWSSFFQLHKAADDFCYVYPAYDLLYGLLGNQVR